MTGEAMNVDLDRFLTMIQAGNGWYAMAVGLTVVFSALVIVSVLISLNSAFFARREIWKRRLAEGRNGFDAMADAIRTPSNPPLVTASDPDEAELAAVAAAVALALHRLAPRRVEHRDHDGPSDVWRLTGRIRSHSGAAEIMAMHRAEMPRTTGDPGAQRLRLR